MLIYTNQDNYARIRQFLKYLSEREITDTDYSRIVPHHKRRRPLPSTYTPEEIIKLESVIDTGTNTGKRNLAIVRLASRLGLRSGDIAKLNLSEIDFHTGYIRLIQEKTGLPLAVRIPRDVEDSLLGHLDNDKHASEDGFVFHCMSAPYGRITTSVIRHAVNTCFNAAGIETVGKKHGPHTFRSSMAEIGDVTRFPHRSSLIAFAGIDPDVDQSGKHDASSVLTSKRGSPHLRKTLFQIVSTYLKRSPADEPVYQFLDKKRSEGKPYYVYMTAAANKFLRIYYARLKEVLSTAEDPANELA